MDLKYYYYECFVVIFLLCVNGSICFFEDDYDESPSFGRCPWIRNKLKNGRVKIRSRGRIAKFVCDPGYELAGKRFATCVRGQWNNPIPVCVARGCSRVPGITNGRVTEMYRGALLTYDCNPGYTLDGVVSIYCDGRRWSTTPPTCVVTTSDPETTCDFEDPDLCGWNHDPTHDFDWKRNQFSTPSGHVGTGPSYDHTFGPGKGGFYLYIEASSPRKVNDTSRLFSPVYPPDYSGGCFIFWYHMYGATTGGLRAYIKPESHVFGEVHPAWEMYGDQGNEWRRGNIVIPALHENFQIVIEAIRGTSYIGDSAIDDVKLTTTDCESMKNTTDPIAHTDAESCRGRCRETVEGTACGCNDNCFANDNCCNDYTTLCTAGNDTSVDNPDEPIDDELGKTSSPVTVTIAKDSLTENETKEMPVTTQVVSTSTKSVSETTTESIATTSSLATLTVTAVDVTTTKPSSSTSASTTVQTSLSSTPSTTPTTVPTPSTTSTKATTETTPLRTTTSSTSTSSTVSSTALTTTTTESSTPIIVTTKSPTSVITTSTLSSTTYESTSPRIPIVIVSDTSQSVAPSVLPTQSSTISSTLSTRKTYNLRPRSTTTVSTLSTMSAISTSSNSTFASDTSPIYSSSTSPSSSTTLPTSLREEEITKSTSWRRNITIPAVFTRRFTTATSTQSSSSSSTTPAPTSTPTTLKPSTRSPITSTKSSNIPQTVKTTFHVLKTSQNTVTQVTSESIENHASKLESTNENSPPTVAITAIVIVIIICIAGGLVYYLRKRKPKRQSKLSDDSEMRFLSDNEVMDEYSDASVLDRILIK